MPKQTLSSRASSLLPFSVILIIVGLFIWLMVWDMQNAKGKQNKIALEGYDPISFFSAEGPSLGDTTLTFNWNKQNWYFLSQANRIEFMAHPARYAPQYGGNCAFTTSIGKAQRGLVKFWEVRQGKLYVNANPVSHWLWKHFPNRVQKADREWIELTSKK